MKNKSKCIYCRRTLKHCQCDWVRITELNHMLEILENNEVSFMFSYFQIKDRVEERIREIRKGESK